jgi:hypothetical protein
MPTSHFILMIEGEPRMSETLATQLVRLGVEAIRVEDLAEAVMTVKSKHYAFSGVILPSDLPGKLVLKAMKSIRRQEPTLAAMVYGKPPDVAQTKLLRRAGVLLALWEGYDEGMLRFQINRLVAGEGQPSVRESRRAPTHIPVRVLVGGREKEGMLYSLSEGGCFIESTRASMDGASLKMLFAIEEDSLEVDGVVVFANVPGNLQRPNLPLGMGVRFVDLSPPKRDQISHFIQARLSALEV